MAAAATAAAFASPTAASAASVAAAAPRVFLVVLVWRYTIVRGVTRQQPRGGLRQTRHRRLHPLRRESLQLLRVLLLLLPLLLLLSLLI